MEWAHPSPAETNEIRLLPQWQRNGSRLQVFFFSLSFFQPELAEVRAYFRPMFPESFSNSMPTINCGKRSAVTANE